MNVISMPAEDLSLLTAEDFSLTKKGRMAVDFGDPELTGPQMDLLIAIAYLQSRGKRERGQTYALAETAPGICPVCRYDYASDPNNYCHCTAPHPGDAEAEARALAIAARQRTIKHNNDLAEALAADERAIRELGRSFQAVPAEDAAVIPIARKAKRRA